MESIPIFSENIVNGIGRNLRFADLKPNPIAATIMIHPWLSPWTGGTDSAPQAPRKSCAGWMDTEILNLQ